jgi:hypothetical protein
VEYAHSGQSPKGGGGPSQEPRDPEKAALPEAAEPEAAEPKVPAAQPESTQHTPIMSNLPRTRPQRRSERRPAEGQAKRQAAKRSSAAARRSQGAAAAPRPATSAAPAGGRVTSQASRPAEAAVAVAGRERAPSLPELGVSAAVTAAKIPVRVTAAVMRKSASLIERGLGR